MAKKKITRLWFLIYCWNASFVDFCPQIIIMVPHSLTRVVLMFVGMLTFFTAIIFNSLSGFGAKSGDFKKINPRFCRVYRGLYNQLCSSNCRCFQAEGRGRDSEVYNPYNPCSLGSVHVGLQLSLDFFNVHVLFSGTVPKVAPFSHIIFKITLHSVY